MAETREQDYEALERRARRDAERGWPGDDPVIDEVPEARKRKEIPTMGRTNGATEESTRRNMRDLLKIRKQRQRAEIKAHEAEMRAVAPSMARLDDVYQRSPDEQPRQELDHPVVPLVEVGVTDVELDFRRAKFDDVVIHADRGEWRRVLEGGVGSSRAVGPFGLGGDVRCAVSLRS